MQYSVSVSVIDNLRTELRKQNAVASYWGSSIKVEKRLLLCDFKSESRPQASIELYHRRGHSRS